MRRGVLISTFLTGALVGTCGGHAGGAREGGVTTSQARRLGPVAGEAHCHVEENER